MIDSKLFRGVRMRELYRDLVWVGIVVFAVRFQKYSADVMAGNNVPNWDEIG
jgi:hypothetical protein